MTRNNLEDHLSWLLRTRPFIPPGAGPLQSFVKSRPNPGVPQEILDKGFPARSPGEIEPIIASPTARTPGRTDVKGFARPSLPQESPVQGHSPDTSTGREPCDSGAMARLRSAPKSASKPRLTQLSATRTQIEHASQQQVVATPPIATNALVSLRDRYSAHCRRAGGNQAGQISEASHLGEQLLRGHPTDITTPTTSRTENCPLTVESIDLTGDDVHNSLSGTVEVFDRPRTIWREDSASRERPLPKKGRKRKSDEFDADHIAKTPKSRTKRSQIEVEAKLRTSPRTIATDTYPNEAPPPYSTMPHVSQGQRSKHPVGDHSQPASSGDNDYEEHIVTETRTRTEMRRKRKPVSRVSSGSGEALGLQDYAETGDKAQVQTRDGAASNPTASEYPELPVVTCSQSPTPEGSKSSRKPKLVRQQRRHIIPNSDAEEEEEEEYGVKSDFWDDIDEFDAEATGRKDPSDANPRDSPTQGKQPVPREDPRTRGIKSPTSESHESRKQSFATGVDIPDHGGKNSQASPFQCDSPTKFVKYEGREAKNGDIQQAATAVMRQMLAQPFSETKECQLRLQGLWEEIKQRAIRYLREGNNPPPALTEERRLLKKQFEGMDRVINLKVEYLKLTDFQHKLGDKLLEAYDEGHDLSTLQKELNKTSLSLEQKEAEIATVFEDADLVSIFKSEVVDLHPGKPDGYAETRPEVVIQSTQALVGINRKSAVLRSSDLPPTQVVQQTQVAQALKTMPTTPSKMPSIEKLGSRQQMPVSEAMPQSKFGEVMSRAFLRVSTPPPNPTEIAAYFSKRNGELSAIEKPIGSIQANSGMGWPKRSTPDPRRLNSPQRIEKQRDMGTDVSTCASRERADNWNEREGDGYAKTMAPVDDDDDDDNDDDEQYGFENDEDLLEAEIGLELGRSHSVNREVFAEKSGNLTSHSHTERPQTSKYGSSTVPTAPPSSMRYRWSNDVKAAMKDRFHLRGFRQNQLEAINATLAGKDAFVLMPTGGGKSLCYQLPSIINSGNTRGVTVVVSPLLSLMQDQVDHLQQLSIQAFLYNGEVTAEHRKLIMQGLRDPNVEQLIQLLYVTPEMITKNKALVDAFLSLHDHRKLARIVIDEAHCVSQWGHDFRPDYKAIGEVRQQFRGVPVMALTATATENVKVDVIHNLSIEGCEVFTQSFNRPNLTYEIRSKGRDKEVLDSIANTICGSYMGQSGIIYCLSRQNCERVAENLRRVYGIKAHHYHAGMEAAQKNFVQMEWQAGRYNVIVATIAFGMGIDKPDVRFVIHHTIPKSLEGYYQETGRAGRDGMRSGCYLYYGYRDTSALKRMIDDGEGSREQKDRQQKMLRNVIHFCENRVDCRRVQVLAYFNEPFLSENCNNGCDNCTSSSVFEDRDLTEYAVHAVNLVKHLEGENVTLLHCVDVFRGSKTRKIIDSDHVSLLEYGAGSGLERGDAERLFYRLLSEDALAEHNILNKSGFASQYIRLGRNAWEFASGRRKLKIQVRVSPKAKKTVLHPTRKGTGVAGIMHLEFPQSTNVSSPVQQAAGRRKAREEHSGDLPLHPNGYLHDDFVIPDNECTPDQETSDDAEAFGPIRIKGKGMAAKVSNRALSTPITTDQEMSGLNPVHRDIVESFLFLAKKLAEEIRNAKNLRSQPFSDNILRRMAIYFPKDEDEMLQIEGIEPDKVRRYGKKFHKLIRNHRNQYQSILANNEDIRFDKPVDPNHENVITILSSDEEDLDDPDDHGSASEPSRFFKGPEVEAFNSQFAQYANPSVPPVHSNFASHDNRSRGGFRGKSRGNAGTKKKYSRYSSRAGSLMAKSKDGAQKKSAGNPGKRANSGSWSNTSTFSTKGKGPPRGGGGRHGMSGGNPGGGSRGIGMMPT